MGTFGPGASTPIHRHDYEEIFIVLKGGGTVYIAPPSNNQFPGEPVAIPVSANSTFSIPVNAVHQVLAALVLNSRLTNIYLGVERTYCFHEVKLKS